MAKAPELPISLYESIFIIRQDVSSADVDKVVEDFEKLINDYKGEVVKKEYWGLRNLAYEIDNNNRGHYFFLGLRAGNDLLAELDRKVMSSVCAKVPVTSGISTNTIFGCVNVER